MPEHSIENWLVFNWNEQTTRTRKSEPDTSSLGVHEIATKLTLNVHVPEVEMPELEADIEIPQAHVESSRLDDVDEADVPGWQDVLEEVLAENPSAEYPEDGDELTLTVLQRAPGRPDIQEVEEAVLRRLRERNQGDA